jgi:hypothetical protein
MLFRAENDPGKARCGIGSDRKAYAFDYKYVLPQVAKYELDQGGPNFSFASIDWTQLDAPLLLTGNYHRREGYDNPPPTLAWWKLEGTRIESRDRLLTDGLKNSTQGAVSYAGKLWLSCYNGKEAHLYVGRNGRYVTHSWPEGCEDLHYSPHSGNLWCLTEGRRKRIVFAVKLSDYS